MAEVETTQDGAVLTITLNRPDVLNAFTADMHRELVGAFEDARDPAVRAVVVTGAGRGFCVGQDLNEFGEAARDIAGRLRNNYHPTVLAVRGLEKPVLAAVNGPAAGAGLSLRLRLRPAHRRREARPSSRPSSTSGSSPTWAAPSSSAACSALHARSSG